MAFLKKIGMPIWATCSRAGRHSAWMLAAALMFASGARAQTQSPPTREYQVKAVFLFNFAQFVDWPAAAFANGQEPLVIGVLGEDPFGASLDEIVREEKANSHPLVVRRYRRAEDVAGCHILFISSSEVGRLEQIMTRLKGRSILTVGDTEGFAMRGVMIRFVTEKSKIRLKINLDAAKAAGLTISSKLLRPAEIVTAGKD